MAFLQPQRVPLNFQDILVPKHTSYKVLKNKQPLYFCFTVVFLPDIYNIHFPKVKKQNESFKSLISLDFLVF